MDKSMLNGIVIGAVVAITGGVIASATIFTEKAPEFAQVSNIEELTETINTPREVCEDVPITRKAAVKDKHKIAGSALGAVVGGLLGNQVGGGSGKKIATIAGAAAGGYAGNQVQGNMQDNDTYTTTERRCHTVTDSHQKIIAYKVTYSIGEEVSTIRMDKKPENRIPLKDGKLVLNY
ncbi:MAG: glycine zipper 2TM domain-containing protein [Thiotrichaceae bacterium]|nr:glycine zipper 2TM domain-containing protein [Thiotrichaceae bacterium]